VPSGRSYVVASLPKKPFRGKKEGEKRRRRERKKKCIDSKTSATICSYQTT